jgi:TonB family protein
MVKAAGDQSAMSPGLRYGLILVLAMAALTRAPGLGAKAISASSKGSPPNAEPAEAVGVLQVSAKQSPIPRELQTQLKSKDPAKRREAANELGVLRSKGAVRPLRDLLFDGDASVREAAAFALGQIADPAATKSLIYVLADKDAHVRSSAAFALGMIEDTSAAEDLSNLLDDSEAEVRGSAIFALGLMHDDSAVDELIEALNDSTFDVRYDSVWALGQIGEPDAAEHLRASLLSLELVQVPDSSREAFREAVQSALENIQAQGGNRKGQSSGSARPRRAGSSTTAEKDAGHASRFPAVRQSITPARTEAARGAGVNGPVSLKVMVAADGRAARAYVTHRAGYGLDRRAVEAVLQYKFDPGLRDGLPQSEWMTLELQFPAK